MRVALFALVILATSACQAQQPIASGPGFSVPMRQQVTAQGLPMWQEGYWDQSAGKIWDVRIGLVKTRVGRWGPPPNGGLTYTTRYDWVVDLVTGKVSMPGNAGDTRPPAGTYSQGGFSVVVP